MKLKRSLIFSESVYGKDSFIRSLYYENLNKSLINSHNSKIIRSCLNYMENFLNKNANAETINELSYILKKYNLNINLENKKVEGEINSVVSINDLGMFALLVIEQYEKTLEELTRRKSFLEGQLNDINMKKGIKEKDLTKNSGLHILNKVCS